MNTKKGNWYAVMRNYDDDWGSGSYNFAEAAEMLRAYIADGYDEAMIAEINEGNDPICVAEYRIDDIED